MDKKQIRVMMLERRRGMTREKVMDKSLQISEKVLASGEYSRAECIFTFISFDNEVDTGWLIRRALADGKKVAAPIVKNGTMMFRYFTLSDELEEGQFGIKEPAEDMPKAYAKKDRTLLIMPGTAFDRKRNRIGFGKGYYDKWLAERPGLNKIALAFDLQIYDGVIPNCPSSSSSESVKKRNIMVPFFTRGAATFFPSASALLISHPVSTSLSKEMNVKIRSARLYSLLASTFSEI